MSRFEEVIREETCKECGETSEVQVKIDTWSGVPGFVCPVCGTNQEP